MAIYAIGDVQGCFDELSALIKKISFNPKKDKLWFVGDLVNRGPKSLETLRWIKSLGDKATTVLGNHDLHLLAAYADIREIKKTSSLYHVIHAKDIKELIDWIRHQPLMHFDPSLNIAMVHAGLLPSWTIKKALSRASEVENVLRSNRYLDFLKNMYGDQPNSWDKTLKGWERLRVITNTFTRLRYCNPDGAMDLNEKGPVGSQAPELKPWFEIEPRNSLDTKIIFGHWSSLGSYNGNNVIAIDTGCVWGGRLTAIRIDNNSDTKYQIECEVKRPIPEKYNTILI